MDTCHVFAAGYDIRSQESWHKTMEEFDSVIGVQRLSVLHLNDSKQPLGSNTDRHEHIGAGRIGLDGFRAVVNDPRLQKVPMILETPKDKAGEWDKENLRTLRSLVAGSETPSGNQ